MTKPLLFLGSNSSIQLYVDAAARQGITVAGILDSDYYGNTESYKGLPVLGSEADINKWKDTHDFFIATNWSPDADHARDAQKRNKLIALVEELGIRCINLIDPTTYIGSTVKLGHGIYIGFCVYIEHGCDIGDFACIRHQSAISHDTKVGKNTVLQGHVAIGNVEVGNNVYIGMWSKIFKTDKMTVGDGAIIYQALWVARDVKPNEHVRLTKEAIKIYRNMNQEHI